MARWCLESRTRPGRALGLGPGLGPGLDSDSDSDPDSTRTRTLGGPAYECIEADSSFESNGVTRPLLRLSCCVSRIPYPVSRLVMRIHLHYQYQARAEPEGSKSHAILSDVSISMSVYTVRMFRVFPLCPFDHSLTTRCLSLTTSPSSRAPHALLDGVRAWSRNVQDSDSDSRRPSQACSCGQNPCW